MFQSRHLEFLAEQIRENEHAFKSNSAHAGFAADMARKLHETNPRVDVSRFIMACMPRWQVGSAKSNVWERTARVSKLAVSK